MHSQAAAIFSCHHQADMGTDVVKYAGQHVMGHHVGGHRSIGQLLLQQVKVLRCRWACTHRDTHAVKYAGQHVMSYYVGPPQHQSAVVAAGKSTALPLGLHIQTD